MHTKTKKISINEHKKILKKIVNLHFLLNNIFTRLFKELKKYKNDYKKYLNYICKNYTIHLNVYLLSIFVHMHEITS